MNWMTASHGADDVDYGEARVAQACGLPSNITAGRHKAIEVT